jgi:hypothetical protein
MTDYWHDGRLGRYWLDRAPCVDRDYAIKARPGASEDVTIVEGQLVDNGDGTWTMRWSDGTEETLISTGLRKLP